MKENNVPIEIKRLDTDDIRVFARVHEDVFDDPIDMDATSKFLATPGHEIVVALDSETDEIIGFVSAAVLYHPDKTLPQLFINEVSVAGPYRRRGIGQKLMQAMLRIGAELNLREAWLGTEPDNVEANALYKSIQGKGPEGFVMWEFDLVEKP